MHLGIVCPQGSSQAHILNLLQHLRKTAGNIDKSPLQCFAVPKCSSIRKRIGLRHFQPIDVVIHLRHSEQVHI